MLIAPINFHNSSEKSSLTIIAFKISIYTEAISTNPHIYRTSYQYFGIFTFSSIPSTITGAPGILFRLHYPSQKVNMQPYSWNLLN